MNSNRVNEIRTNKTIAILADAASRDLVLEASDIEWEDETWATIDGMPAADWMQMM